MTLNPLIGQTIMRAYLSLDRMLLRLDLLRNGIMFAECEADCCSETWIEGIEDPAALLGVVSAVEDLELDERPYDKEQHPEIMQFYGVRITTDKGSALVDFRNESNGYYGGSLRWFHFEYDNQDHVALLRHVEWTVVE